MIVPCFVTVVLLVLSAAGCGGEKAAPTSTVQGTLTQAGKPLVRVRVLLKNASDKKPRIIQAADTGADGEFGFEKIPPGEYSLSVSLPLEGAGMCSASVDANVQTGRTTKVRFELPESAQPGISISTQGSGFFTMFCRG